MRSARARFVAVLTAVLLVLSLSGPGTPPSSGHDPFPLSWLWDWLPGPLGHGGRMPATPAQQGGTAAGKGHYVPAGATRGGARFAKGHAPGKGIGELARYQPHAPARRPVKTDPAWGDQSYNPKTSVRIPSAASATSDVYRNADGSYTRRVYEEPVNYRTANGAWQPVDTGLATGPDGRIHEKANGYAVSFAPSGTDPALVSVQADARHSVAYGVQGAAAVAPVVSGTTVTYPALLPQTDLRLSTFAAEVKESLVLHSAAAPSSWVFPLRLTGLTPRLAADGSVEFRDERGQVVSAIPPASMSDANIDPHSGEPKSSSELRYQITTLAGEPALVLTADAAWLHDPSRKYPVTVDPTFSEYSTGSTYAETSWPGNHSGDEPLKTGTADGSSIKAYSFLQFSTFGNDYAGAHVSAVSLHIFDFWAWTCAAKPFSVNPITQSWSPGSVSRYPGPSFGPSIGSITADPHAACKNTAADTSVGTWMTVPLQVDTFNSWAKGGTNNGLAVTASQSDETQWKQFDSRNAPNPPYLQVTYTDNVPPQVDTAYPPDNYGAPTLTPELTATGHDPDAWPTGNVSYAFTVYDANGNQLATSGTLTTPDWVVPSGVLKWARSYFWTVQTYDGNAWSDPNANLYALTTPVPQPPITSELSQNSGAHGFDQTIGNYTTSATDAQVATVGPSLSVVRDYNSDDPRTGGGFGAGWSSLFDARATEHTDPSGAVSTVAVTYPDGSEVAYGRNADGTFAPPQGRFATFVPVTGGGYKLTDKTGTVYTFTQPFGSGAYGITGIADGAGRAETFAYSGGQLTTVTSASGRALHLSWITPPGAAHPHVATVSTDAATAGDPGTVAKWTYGYTGDELSSVCPPTSATDCTRYGYTTGTAYRNQVQNLGPHSYWRLNEASGTTAASSVLFNEGTDNGTYTNVTLGQSGPLAGSAATAAGFDGASSYVQLPHSLVANAQYQTISLWFRTSTGGGVLFSYQADPITNSTSGNYTPSLYVGTDGRLFGEFWYAGGANPIGTSGSVADGQWHQVVLSAAGNTQSMYLDGALVGSKTGLVKLLSANSAQNEYVGAGFIGGGWPDQPHANAASAPSFFKGSIADVALFDQYLPAGTVGQLYAAGHTSSQVVNKVTRPSGDVYAQVTYDPVTGTVSQVTDENGGTWQIGAPTVGGSSRVYVASVLGDRPLKYYRLNESSGEGAVNMVRDWTTTPYNSVVLGADGPFSDSGGAAFDGTSSYMDISSYGYLPSGGNGEHTVGLWFRTTTPSQALFALQYDALTDTPTGPAAEEIYVGSDGKLVSYAPNSVPYTPITTSTAVTDGKWHFLVMSAGTDSQALYLDGAAVGNRSGAPSPLAFQHAYLGAGSVGGYAWPDQPNGETPTPTYFAGSISDVAYYQSGLSAAQVTQQWTSYKSSSGLEPVSMVKVTDPGGKPVTYSYDLLNGSRLVAQTDALGNTTNYGYDTSGFLAITTDPNGNSTMTGHDVRGNVVSQTTCQWTPNSYCQTTYYTYYPDDTSTTLTPDPRNDLVLTVRDGRSSSATDDTYKTTYAYDPAGNRTGVTTPAVDGFPSGRTAKVDYTDGKVAAADSGTAPVGLPYQVTTPGGRVQRVSYYRNGDVAQVTDPAGLVTKYTYDALGHPLTKTVVSDAFPAGLTTTMTYDLLGEVRTETDPAVTNRVTGAVHTPKTTTTYDPDGRVLSQTVADLTGGDVSRTVSATYDLHGLQYTSTDASGATTTYGYNGYGYRVKQINPANQETDYAYDPNGHLLTTTLVGYVGDPVSPSTPTRLVESSRAYDPAGRLASVTDSMGRVTQYQYYDNGQLNSVCRTDATQSNWVCKDGYAYDSAGNVEEHITNADESNITDYTVDAAGRVTTIITDNVGGKGRGPGDIPWDPRTTTYTYTPDDFIKSSTLSKDTTSVTTDFTYDPLGRMKSRTLHNTTGDQTTTWALDQRGLATSMTDALGNVTTYVHDEAGRPTVTSAPVVNAEAGGAAPVAVHPVTMTGYDAFGERTESSDENGNVATVGYDANGRQTSVTLPTYTQPGTGRQIAPTSSQTYTVLGQVETATDPLGHQTRYTYDQLGDVATVTAPGGGVTHNVYDTDGEVTSSTDPTGAQTQATYDFAGRKQTTTQLVRQPSPAEYTTTYGYTPAGFLGTVTSPSGYVSSYGYNDYGQPLSSTDPAGNTTTYQYDLAGRRVATILPDGTSRTTTYDAAGNPLSASMLDGTGKVLTTASSSYDLDNRPTSSTDPRRHTTAVGYDAIGRVTGQTEPVSDTESISTSFGYDAHGNLTRFTDGRGNAFLTTYNPWNLPESKIEPATQAHPNPADRTFTTAYDANGRPATRTAPGGVTKTATYDDAGNLTTLSGAGAEADTTDRTFGYDLDGRMTSVSAPGGADTFGLDDRGLPLSVSGPSGNSSFSYTAEGNPATRTDAAGTTNYTYDTAGRLKTLTNPLSGADLAYGYNTLNQLDHITYGSGGDVRRFGYDAVHRLASDTLTNGDGSTTYASIGYGYDDNGNLTSKTTSGFAGSASNTYTYDHANRLASWSNGSTTVGYGYDASGNRTRFGAQTFTYDARDELTSGAGKTYTYTARGTLNTETAGGTTVTARSDAFNQVASQGGQSYRYDGLGRMVAATGVSGLSYTGTGNTLASDGTANYTRDPSGQLVAVQSGADQRMVWTDRHDDVVGQFASAGTALAGSATYDPLGNLTATANLVGHLGYQSEWTDTATGRVNMASRWYNPATGQFDSHDSASLSPVPTSVSANPFAYVNDNPLAGTDPSGQCSWYDVVCGAKKAVSTVSNAVSSAASTVSNWASDAWNTASNWASDAWNTASNWASDAWNTVSGWASSAWNAVTNTVSNIYNGAKHAVNSVVNGATHVINSAANAIRDAAQRAKQAAVRAANAVKQAAANVVHTATHYAQAAAHVVSTAYHATTKAVDAAAHYVEHHAAAIASFVASTAVFIGCDAAMGVIMPGAGAVVGAVACGALAGAVGGAVGNLVGAAQSGHFSWSSLGTATLMGGVAGAAGGLLGSLGGKAASWLGGKAAGALSNLVRGGVDDVASDAASTAFTDASTDAASDAGSAAADDGASQAGTHADPDSAPAGGHPDADPAADEPTGGKGDNDNGGGCTEHSFNPATPVLMANGTTKPIKDVKLGDAVKSTDPATGNDASEPVVLLHDNHDTDLTDVTVRSDHGQPVTLHTTSHHPFWNASRGTWTNAADLKPGTRLRTDDKRTETVVAVKTWTGRHEMRDLTVADLHTYYVIAGNVPVLVHNCGLQDFADSQREVPGTKFASEYTSPSGQKYYSTNRHGMAGQLDDMPELQDAIDAAGHHGGCAEVGCLIQAYDAEGPSAISGGTMQTVNVRNPMSSRAAEQGTPALPCGRCQRLLGLLGIGWG